MSETESLARRIAADRAQRKAARRRVIIAWWGALALFIAVIFGGRQFYHWAKAKRAGHFVDAGDRFAAAGKPNEAADRYRAALQLDPMGYRALSSAGRLATHLGRPEAVDLWGEVVKLPDATNEDRQEYADALLKAGRPKVAERVIERLLKTDPDTRTLLMASGYSRLTGDPSKAIEFARVAVKRAPGDDKARFILADLLATSNDTSEQAEARQILWDLSGKEGTYRQPAIQGLASAPELKPEERPRVLQMLEGIPSPNITQGLLASDLRLQLHPEDADKIFNQTVARWNSSGPADLNQLARWLNLREQPERVLSLFSVDQAVQDNQLMLSRLDALATLQRWNEIDSLLDHPNLTLDPSVLESFRARAAQEKHSTLDAEMHWNHAISLASNDPYKLRFVANFAEQSHANAAALKAYDQLAKMPQHAITAYRATQRLSALTGDATVQRAAAEKIASLAPSDPNAVDQLAYLNLLLGGDVENNFEKARALAEKYPDRLSFRVTAALGYLRKHDPGLALAQFKAPPGTPPIEWKKTPPSWRAVYAATLMANDQGEAAQEIMNSIPPDSLSPQEKELIVRRK
jgi:hypothetical protein